MTYRPSYHPALKLRMHPLDMQKDVHAVVSWTWEEQVQAVGVGVVPCKGANDDLEQQDDDDDDVSSHMDLPMTIILVEQEKAVSFLVQRTVDRQSFLYIVFWAKRGRQTCLFHEAYNKATEFELQRKKTHSYHPWQLSNKNIQMCKKLRTEGWNAGDIPPP